MTYMAYKTYKPHKAYMAYKPHKLYTPKKEIITTKNKTK